MKYHTVLTIAGSDSGGGAGIQADIKTISACGCYAASAITAITVQNTIGVQSVFSVPTAAIEGQIDAVLSDIGADCVKIGMLHSSEVVKCIAQQLKAHHIEKVVLDTVMVSTSGHRLIEESAIQTLIEELIPLATLITPNIPEAEILLGREISKQEDLPSAAKALAEKYKVSVLLKAGHLTENRLTDYFYNYSDGTTLSLSSERCETRNTHGTGCTLSSAIAAMIAKGYDTDEAVLKAKEYLAGAIVAGAKYEIGHGHGPVCHFWNMWDK